MWAGLNLLVPVESYSSTTWTRLVLEPYLHTTVGREIILCLVRFSDYASAFLHFFTSPFLTILSFFFLSFWSPFCSLNLIPVSPSYSFLSPPSDPFLDTPDILPLTPFLCHFWIIILSYSSLLLLLTCPPHFLSFTSSVFPLYQAFIYVCWFPENVTEFTPNSCHSLAQPLTDTNTRTHTNTNRQKHNKHWNTLKHSRRAHMVRLTFLKKTQIWVHKQHNKSSVRASALTNHSTTTKTQTVDTDEEKCWLVVIL